MQAIIPSKYRICSALQTVSTEGGIVLKAAPKGIYRREESILRQNIKHSWGNILPNRKEHRFIVNHGIAVSLEIFDSVEIGIPFKCSELVNELQCIERYTAKTQYCIINATLRWLCIQDNPQARKWYGGYILDNRET